jgi:hypothetical protein
MIKILLFILIIVIVLFFYLQHTKYNLNEISILKKSLKYRGNGLFATKNLKKGDCLFTYNPSVESESDIDTLIVKAWCSGQMNDADFIYPKSFSYDDLYERFYNYENNKNTKNNVEHSNENYSVVIKNIYNGDEITKTYGMNKWFGFVYLDIIDKNSYNLFYPKSRFILTEEEKIKATSNLVQVAKDLG